MKEIDGIEPKNLGFRLMPANAGRGHDIFPPSFLPRQSRVDIIRIHQHPDSRVVFRLASQAAPRRFAESLGPLPHRYFVSDARQLVNDLFEPNLAIYWTDFLLSMARGSGFAGVAPGSVERGGLDRRVCCRSAGFYRRDVQP